VPKQPADWRLRYAMAVAVVALAFAARFLLQPVLHEHAPLLIFTLAVTVSAWYGGLGPGLLATALSALCGTYFITHPAYSLRVADPSDQVRLALFLLIGVSTSWLAHARLTSHGRAVAAEGESRERGERFRKIYENAPTGIAITDMAGKFVQANAAYCRMIGYGEAELREMEFSSLIHPEDREHNMALIRRLVGGELPSFEIENRYVGRGGSTVWVHKYVSVLRDERGGPTHIIALVTDVSARRQIAEEREQLLEREREARWRAEEANRLKEEFLGTVSHELRTPLMAIAGWADMLEAGGLDPETARHAVRVIRRNCEQQKRIVEDVLDVSRFITGKLSLEHESVDLAEVVRAALESVRPAAEAKDIRLWPDLAPGVTVTGDPHRLQQVVWNMLTNAVKFTPLGGEVRVGVGRLLTHARVEVSDTGEGIAPEFLPYVFDRFRQADSSITRRHGGLGLGLSIVRHVVEAHGGSVHAYSAGEGQGASFTVDLPLPVGARVEAPAARGGGGAKEESLVVSPATNPAPKGDGVPPPLLGVRALLVEDDPDTLEVLSLFLRRGGAAVTAARSTAEALDALSRVKADVIVADIGMPGADGYELLRRVRSRAPEDGGQTPAVALTAYAAESDRSRALRSGFQKHLAKPVSPDALLAAVADLTGLSARGEA